MKSAYLQLLYMVIRRTYCAGEVRKPQSEQTALYCAALMRGLSHLYRLGHCAIVCKPTCVAAQLCRMEPQTHTNAILSTDTLSLSSRASAVHAS